MLSAEKIASITEIFCSEEEIENLQGIEFFTALEELCCFDNNLTSLDVSSNTALKHLECYNNNLTSLNVSNNAALEFLSCYNNSLTELDVSHNTALVTLSLFLNGLTDVDVSNNTALKELNCGCNSLNTLDVSNNTALERLWCQENNLTTLDISHNTALDELYWWENNLTSLDITGLSGLGGYGDVGASDNVYNIRTAVGTGRTFDLSTLPGNFDVSKASDWNGGIVSGNILTIDEGVYTVTYTYDCGERQSFTFSLTTLQEITSIEATVTPPVNGEKPADLATVVTAPENSAVFRNLVWDKIAEEDFTGTYWFDTWTPMEEDETFQAGYYYRVKLYFDAKEGFGFFKNVTGKVNGKDHNGTYGDVYDYADSSYAYLCFVYKTLHVHETGAEYTHDENSHWKECTKCGAATTEKVAHTPDHEGHATEKYAIKCTEFVYVIEEQLAPTQKITRIDVTVTPPAVGAPPADTADIVSTPENSAAFEELCWYLASGDEFDADIFESGNAYAVEICVTPNDNFAFSDEMIVYCNGMEIPYYSDEIDDEGGSYFEKDTDGNIWLWVVFDELTNGEFTVTFDGNGGTPSVGSMTTTNQKLTSLPGASRSGSYSFDGWYTEKSGGTKVTTATVFSANTTVYAHWTYTGGNSSGSGYTYYTIKATAGVNGTISPSDSVSVRSGKDQTFTITPNTGYAISDVKIDGKSVGAVKSYTFENVKGNHTIEAIFMKANGNPQTGVFVDVLEGSYYEDAVAWAAENGITKGTSDTTFDPNGICTRAQAVTLLWRAAGSPAPKTSTMPFTDVTAGSYYYDAVLWAVENGITTGTSDTTFSPDVTCSRAQIVTFLWRSQEAPAAGAVNPFTDMKVDAYYTEAVLWAVKEDVTKGTTDTTFSPDANCTRAQIVTFIWRALAE